MTVCKTGILVGAAVGGILVDGISGGAPLVAGGEAVIAGAAVPMTARVRS